MYVLELAPGQAQRPGLAVLIRYSDMYLRTCCTPDRIFLSSKNKQTFALLYSRCHVPTFASRHYRYMSSCTFYIRCMLSVNAPRT